MTRRDTLMRILPTRIFLGLRAHSARTCVHARACLTRTRIKTYRQFYRTDAGPHWCMPLGTGHDASRLIYDKILQCELSLFGAFGRHGWSHQGNALALALFDAFRAAIMAVAEHTSRAQLAGAYIGESRSQGLSYHGMSSYEGQRA
jgi:hypothetical protein